MHRSRPTLLSTPLAACRRTSPLLQYLLFVLCLGAFLAQNQVALTHIHSQGVAATSATQAPQPQGTGEDPASCVLCQIATHGGAAPLPMLTAYVAVQLASISIAVEQVSAAALASPSYYWQSRGPPLR